MTDRPRIVLRFDVLSDATLVATASNGGRSAAAIVHPRRSTEQIGHDIRRWVLAGDVPNDERRPTGTAPSAMLACAYAAQALGEALGLQVDGYTVAQ